MVYLVEVKGHIFYFNHNVTWQPSCAKPARKKRKEKALEKLSFSLCLKHGQEKTNLCIANQLTMLVL
jgi:hypothetical protein